MQAVLFLWCYLFKTKHTQVLWLFFQSCSLHSRFCFFPLQCLRFLHVFYEEEYVGLDVVCWLKSHLYETYSGTTATSQDDIYPFSSNIGLLAWN